MVTAEWDDAAPSSKEIAQAIAWHLAALYGPPPPKGAACREGQVLIRVGEVQAALTVSGRTKLERSRISDLGGSLGVSITSPTPPGMALHTRRTAALVDLLQTSVVQRHGGRHHERSVALVLDLPAPPALIDGVKAWQPLQRRRRMPQDATKRLQDWDSWLARRLAATKGAGLVAPPMLSIFRQNLLHILAEVGPVNQLKLVAIASPARTTLQQARRRRPDWPVICRRLTTRWFGPLIQSRLVRSRAGPGDDIEYELTQAGHVYVRSLQQEAAGAA